MTISSLQVVLFTLVFVVPGYIVFSIYSFVTTRGSASKELLLLRFLSFSALNLVIAYPLLAQTVLVKSYTDEHPFLTGLAFLVAIFIEPLMIGIVIGKIDSSGWLREVFFKAFGLNAMNSTPTAWDVKFSALCKNENKGSIIIVTMKDTTRFAGFFGGKGSVASTDAKERDLYLETAYIYEEEQWIRRERTDGILLRGDDIVAIEFLLDTDESVSLPEPAILPLPATSDQTQDKESGSQLDSEESKNAEDQEGNSNPEEDKFR